MVIVYPTWAVLQYLKSSVPSSTTAGWGQGALAGVGAAWSPFACPDGRCLNESS